MLPAAKDYSVFIWLLVCWLGICLFTLGVPLSSSLYFFIYLLAAPLTWLLYLLAARYLYLRVFDRYPGIAFAGRSSLWIAASAVPISAIVSIFLSPGRLTKGLTFSVITLLDRGVLFGIAFFLLLLVSVMVRYPISISQNIAIHSLVLAAVLLSQSLLQIADQWAAYRYTAYTNILAAAFDTVLACAWAFLLTNAGDSAVIRIRQNIKPEAEVHLLGQLDALNGILLRAARK